MSPSSLKAFQLAGLGCLCFRIMGGFQWHGMSDVDITKDMYRFDDLGVSKNRGTPKWMVYNGKPYEQMDDLGGNTPIFGNTHI